MQKIRRPEHADLAKQPGPFEVLVGKVHKMPGLADLRALPGGRESVRNVDRIGEVRASLSALPVLAVASDCLYDPVVHAPKRQQAAAHDRVCGTEAFRLGLI
jgi:hypothetical protein